MSRPGAIRTPATRFAAPRSIRAAAAPASTSSGSKASFRRLGSPTSGGSFSSLCEQASRLVCRFQGPVIDRAFFIGAAILANLHPTRCWRDSRYQPISLPKIATWPLAGGCLIGIVKFLSHGRRARSRVLFGSLTALLFLAACSPSAFERQHEQAVFQNPTGVELEIRTKDGRKQFSVSEPVQFEEFYAAKFAGLWHIEVIDGGNEAS